MVDLALAMEYILYRPNFQLASLLVQHLAHRHTNHATLACIFDQDTYQCIFNIIFLTTKNLAILEVWAFHINCTPTSFVKIHIVMPIEDLVLQVILKVELTLLQQCIYYLIMVLFFIFPPQAFIRGNGCN